MKHRRTTHRGAHSAEALNETREVPSVRMEEKTAEAPAMKHAAKPVEKPMDIPAANPTEEKKPIEEPIPIMVKDDSGSRSTQFPTSPATSPAGFKAVYTPGSQGSFAEKAFDRQSAANVYTRATYGSNSVQKNRRKSKRAARIVAIVALIALIGGGSAFGLYINSINGTLNKGTKTDEQLTMIDSALSASREKSFTEPFYMLLIGSDKRKNDNSMGARSDTNVVVRVDPVKNVVTLVSIPRDTMIEIADHGTNKFNAAYSYGNVAGVIKEANKLLNIKISHYTEVDFDKLVSLVDAVGGVDVKVDEDIDDPKAGKVKIKKGKQRLSGEAALVFSRTRQYTDGDFSRTANQRKLISAIANKVVDLPVTELPNVISKAAESVTTDMSVTDIVSLAQQFQDCDEVTYYSAMVPSTTGMVDEVSYVFADKEKIPAFMKLVESSKDPNNVSKTAANKGDASSVTSGVVDGNSNKAKTVKKKKTEDTASSPSASSSASTDGSSSETTTLSSNQ